MSASSRSLLRASAALLIALCAVWMLGSLLNGRDKGSAGKEVADRLAVEKSPAGDSVGDDTEQAGAGEVASRSPSREARKLGSERWADYPEAIRRLLPHLGAMTDAQIEREKKDLSDGILGAEKQIAVLMKDEAVFDAKALRSVGRLQYAVAAYRSAMDALDSGAYLNITPGKVMPGAVPGYRIMEVMNRIDVGGKEATTVILLRLADHPRLQSALEALCAWTESDLRATADAFNALSREERVQRFREHKRARDELVRLIKGARESDRRSKAFRKRERELKAKMIPGTFRLDTRQFLLEPRVLERR